MELNELVLYNKVTYRIMNIKTHQWLDKNLFFVKADGSVWKRNYPMDTFMSNQCDYAVYIEKLEKRPNNEA